MRSTSSFASGNNKAAGFVGYGSAGGVRAVEHLRLVMAEVQVADSSAIRSPFRSHGLRKLHHLQTGCAPREIGEPDARSVDCLERRPEDATRYHAVRRGRSPTREALIAVVRSLVFRLQSTRQSDDPVVLDRDVVVDDDRVGKPGPVEIAFDFGRDNGLTITVCSVDDFEGDLGIEDVAVTPGLDRDAAADFPCRHRLRRRLQQRSH